MPHHLTHTRGVSLVELSIVIVIIGLLVGAVSGGLSIRRASEIRSVITDIDGFRVAVEGFTDKYRELPGDMTDAHEYWGGGGATVCGTAGECNGDGDGKITYSASATDNEALRFWQHLSLAGFLEGGYTGTGATITLVPGENSPQTKRDKGGYHVETQANDTNRATGTMFTAGGFLTGGAPLERLLTPAEAVSIDQKTDDGSPDTGKTKGRYYYDGSAWQTGTCLSGSYPTRVYSIARTEAECVLHFTIE